MSSTQTGEDTASVSRRRFLSKAVSAGALAGVSLGLTGSLLNVPREVDAATGKVVSIDSSDTTSDYLNNKLVTGVGISKTVLNPGANETLSIAVISSAVLAGASMIVWRDSSATYTRDGTSGIVNTYSGTTRDSDAIQAAINSLSNGGLIVIRAGTYSLTTSIKPSSKMQILGEGYESTILRRGNSVSLPVSTDVSVYYPLINLSSVTDFSIANLTIDGNSVNNSAQSSDGGDINLLLFNCQRCVISGLRSRDATGDLLNIYSGSKIQVSDVFCDSVYSGTDFSDFVICSNASDVNVSNLVSSGGGHCVEICGLGPPGGPYTTPPSAVHFAGCHFINPLVGDVALVLEAKSVTFASCYFSRSTSGKVLDVAVGDSGGNVSDVRFVSCRFFGNTGDYNINIYQKVSGYSPSDISFVDCRISTGQYGCVLATSDPMLPIPIPVSKVDFVRCLFDGSVPNQNLFYGTNVSYSRVIGCKFTGALTGIALNGGNAQIDLLGNQFDNTATSGTIGYAADPPRANYPPGAIVYVYGNTNGNRFRGNDSTLGRWVSLDVNG